MKHQTNLSKRVSIHFLFVLALIFLNCSSNATVSESTNKTEFVDQEQEITNSIGMKFRLIKAGSFIMGTKYGGVEGTEDTTHQVTLTKDYYIGVYLVTQTQFESIMGENPSHFKGPNHPVDSVTRQEANEFCRRLSVKEGITYRLPYEAEWEYAAKAGTTTEYYWGDSFDKVDEYEWYGGNSSNQTHPVGQKKPNPWRLYDICGNLEEYTLDNYYPKFSPGPHVDPKGPAKPWGTLNTTMKSGNYRWPYPTHSRPAHRHGVYADPNDRVPTIGFRVVREIE